MSELEEKLGAVLSNPQLMQQIMNMAQSLGQASPPPQPQPAAPAPPMQMPPLGDIDPAMLGKIMNLAGKSGIDGQQKMLLNALQPYLSGQRIQKLEKAMRAAKLASAVTSILPGESLPFQSGR